MVYVQDREGKPLMPTERYGKVRRLLDCGRAKVVCRCPFTIRLAYDTPGYVQRVTLGVDAGSQHIGLSATTEQKEHRNVQTKDLKVREWDCPKCGSHHDRDGNAALNILNEVRKEMVGLSSPEPNARGQSNGGVCSWNIAEESSWSSREKKDCHAYV